MKWKKQKCDAGRAGRGNSSGNVTGTDPEANGQSKDGRKQTGGLLSLEGASEIIPG